MFMIYYGVFRWRQNVVEGNMHRFNVLKVKTLVEDSSNSRLMWLMRWKLGFEYHNLCEYDLILFEVYEFGTLVAYDDYVF